MIRSKDALNNSLFTEVDKPLIQEEDLWLWLSL